MTRVLKSMQAAALCAALGVPAAVLAQGAADPQKPVPSSERAAPDAKTAPAAELQGLVTQIHRANTEEIALGKLALARAQSDDVADFGKMMVNDHTKADVDLLQMAREKKVRFTPDLIANAGEPKSDKTAEPGAASANRWQSAQKLAKLSGPEFDREYLKTMTSMHQETLRSLESAQQRVTDADAKDFVKDLISTVQGHEKKAQELAKELSTQGASAAGGR